MSYMHSVYSVRSVYSNEFIRSLPLSIVICIQQRANKTANKYLLRFVVIALDCRGIYCRSQNDSLSCFYRVCSWSAEHSGAVILCSPSAVSSISVGTMSGCFDLFISRFYVKLHLVLEICDPTSILFSILVGGNISDG